MKKITIGILAHVDSGKTTLSEAMLYLSGSIQKLGRVDNRNSFLDTFSLERSRGITIFSKQAILSFNDTEFTLIDTPGHVDFSAETERTLQILDYAILVISATDGIQGHTVTLWNLLKKYNIPCFIFINKMDIETANSDAVLNQLKRKFSENCCDFTVSSENELLENIALCDEALLTKYETVGLSDSDIACGIRQRKIFPCLFGSALKLEGVEALLSCVDKYTVAEKHRDSFGAKVYKISEDKGQKLTFMKITGGTLRVRDVLKSDKNKDGEKVNQIRLYSGEKFTTVDEASAGTVCAVTGITFASAGDGLGEEKDSGMPFLEPVLTYTLVLPQGVDNHTALSKIKILESEDPQLKIMTNERTGEIQVKLMGEIQLEVLQSIISDRFGMNCQFTKGSIIYKETITNTTEGIGHFEPLRHYAEVHLILKPLKRGSGIIIKSDCKEDVLDKNWQRLILTHLYEKTHIGVLTGSPVTDIEITLASGKAHPKHTEGGDFRQATYRAVRQGLKSAESILLEPVYAFTLEVPAENIGRAISDIQNMHGTFEPPEVAENSAVLTGTCPVSTMYDYSKDVRQYTHGKGKLICTLSGYEACHNSVEVIEKIAYDFDSDTANTADSVFCSHGAGYNVKWNEVKSRMHLGSALSERKIYSNESLTPSSFSNRVKNADNLFALDKELMEIFEKTYGPVKSVRPESRHFTFTESSKKTEKQNRPTSKWSGKEYVLVDGYNVIFSWDELRKISEDSIESARDVLINILCNYSGFKKCDVILVFDAYKVKGNIREIEEINGISIVYTKEAETADMYIEKVTHELAKNHKVRVVTSDALEQLIILGNGALRVSSREFYEEIRNAEAEIREIISNTI